MGIQKGFKIEFDGFLTVIFRPDNPMRDGLEIFLLFFNLNIPSTLASSFETAILHF